ncbi:bifunctional 3-(3-hydroxy-phenyl)propionate/3-hydroxycinnamic acid hydroxylase [Streptomyces griseoaurantiacus]|uniref:bifunctional 3-(3-hydroxy-phenyl)propionate/3-hydroxycinnamic acid hydroxylase n=1 Tax=Streptomyces griseoaurantiacus TaxID=68213 RepID=UPI0037ACDE19
MRREDGVRTARRDMECQVAVVGAGPVGMTAAALLAAYGISVVVVERNAVTSNEPKAISIDDEALRIFQAAGLADRVLKIIVPGTGTRYYDASGRAVFHARSAQPFRLGYPFKNPFAQPDLERELHTHLSGNSQVSMCMKTELTGVDQFEDGVGLRCRREGADEVLVRARYVLGCDGGRSTVRELLGIGMTGRSYEDVWLVVDVAGDHHDERYGMHHGDPDRPHVIVPGLDGRCRYEFLLRPGEGEPGVPPSFDLVRRLLAPHRKIVPEQVERAVSYRFNAVVADRWRQDGVFLLGDAAHMMPPFAGQGLNSGIRDAGNLAWKLAEVLAGRLEDTALDTYEQERRPHAEATVRHSEYLGRIVMTTSHRIAGQRDRLIGAAMRSPSGRAFFEQMRYRPMHTYAAGLLKPGASGVPAAVGRQVAQPTVFDTRLHRTRRLDDALGPGWALLGVGVDTACYPTESQAVAPLSPRLAHVAVDERMPRHTGDLTVLVDVDGSLDAEFAKYHGHLVLIRPDRFIAAAWRPGHTPVLPEALRMARRPTPVG